MCPRCELIFVHDIYPEFLRGLEGLDDPTKFLTRAGPSRSHRKRFASLLQEFDRYRQRNRLLEVGCAEAAFLTSATQMGWRCTGVEILPGIARFAREQRGLDVYTGELFDARFADGEFDVVYMNEVLEHIVYPVELLQEVRRVLRPGGLALVRTGNARSWSARFRGSKWFYYERFGTLGHIRFYNPRTVPILAAASGFADGSSRTSGFAFLESAELRGRWFKPFVKFGQSFLSPLAGPCAAGHRLTMRFIAPSHTSAGGE